MAHQMLNPLIRPAFVDEAKALRQVSIDTFLASFARYNTQDNMDHYIDRSFDLEKFKAELEHPEVDYWFFIVDGHKAGYLKLNDGKAQSEQFLDNSIEIERLYTLPEYFGRGIGQAMMNHALKEAQKRERDWVWLGVWEHNPRAIRFYEKYGFEQCGSHPFMMGDDKQIDLLMRKHLRD